MRLADTDVAWSERLCVLDTTVIHAVTDEPIAMSFWLWTRVGPSNHILDRGPDPHRGRSNFGGCSRLKSRLDCASRKREQQHADADLSARDSASRRERGGFRMDSPAGGDRCRGDAASPTTSGGNVTSAGWQVTLCDPVWHVSSRSGVATLRTAMHPLLTY